MCGFEGIEQSVDKIYLYKMFGICVGIIGYVVMCVLMSVCPEVLENGVSKMPPSHITLFRMTPGLVFFFSL